MSFGIAENTITLLHQVFSHFPEIEQVVLFGSRAKGNFKNGSDIDFAVKGDIDLKLLNKISHEIDDLLLPYQVDLVNLSTISHQDLLEHIKRVGIIFYNKNE